jgi:hypothetical protein
VIRRNRFQVVLVGVLGLVLWTSASCGEPDETTQNSSIRQALRHEQAFGLLRTLGGGSVEEMVPTVRSLGGHPEGLNGFAARGRQVSLADVDAQLRAWGWTGRGADCGRDPQTGPFFGAVWSKQLPDREAFFSVDQKAQRVDVVLYTLPVHADPTSYASPDDHHSTIPACIAMSS